MRIREGIRRGGEQNHRERGGTGQEIRQRGWSMRRGHRSWIRAGENTKWQKIPKSDI